MRLPIYLDYMATTPLDPRVAEAMLACLQTSETALLGNASAAHYYGKRASEKIEHATAHLASVIGAKPSEIVWTSGATEANNLALLGAASFYHRKGKHLVTVATEHASVLAPLQALAARGYELTVLPVQENGLLDLDRLQAVLRADTVLLSVMHVNNEIGVIQDVAAIAAFAHARGILFHVDAAQSVGKLSIDLDKIPVDLMSFSAHKAYGPVGVGALFVRQQPRVRLQPLLYGGGQQGGLRSGTLAIHQIVGMATAFMLAEQEREVDYQRIVRLQKLFWDSLYGTLKGICLNGDFKQRVPHNLNISIAGVHPEALFVALQARLAISQGAACNAAKVGVSSVMQALYPALDAKDAWKAQNAIRISFGRGTTEHEVLEAVDYFCAQVRRLRGLGCK